MFYTFYSIIIACGCLGLIYSIITAYFIFKAPSGNIQMQNIASAIEEGANAYLKRQYLTITLVGVIVAVLLFFSLGPYASLGFIIGASLSGLSDFVGLYVSVRANVRTTEAARISLGSALKIAFKAGSVTGSLVVGFALLGISGYYLALQFLNLPERALMEALVSFSFGASLISIFARLGGGIFTKGADVGAYLVGKIEANIPEDDTRNPAVIADYVSDNVGDCAGIAADLFETYAITLVATLLLANILGTETIKSSLMLYPMAIGGVCILGSIAGTFFVRLGRSKNIMHALYKGVLATYLISGLLIFFLTDKLFGLSKPIQLKDQIISGQSLLFCAFAGFVITVLLVSITAYYSRKFFRPVKSIANASLTGHATNIIQGLAVSMEATALPVLVICAGILFSFMMAGLFGLAITATTMLALAGMMITLDCFGPVTDNAGSIASMTNLDNNVRTITDALDAVGKTTKAVTKGFAIGSTGLGALVLFAAYIEELKHFFPNLKIQFILQDPFVMVGLFIGGILPYLFSSLAMKAVGKASGQIVLDVRRQFREIKGILTGATRKAYGVAVDLLTRLAIREMILLSLLPVLTPLILYAVIYLIAGSKAALVCLGALLLGTLVTGLFVAISMTSGGFAFDNAKKLIEEGHLGGKGSEAYKAAITGDTVGASYKDTAGPAINPMIKIVNIVALLLIAAIAKSH